ncbi:hypothetical protein [Lysobacter enzymogenes]|uniref:Uncharacterized protein n=1 Tax=Lysobacter enzymogenes TaxID=69 RepID=A0A3N2RME7_LYSEN|nr:hypothetical protein [Lysobacter enzymogenes]ROU08546.1 hypothetical protein D9T17_03435 [Lysobacter enzymogenes]
MRKFPTALLAASLLAGLPLLAQAESQYSTGTASPITATARLDFQITVPKILFLRVGAGADYSNTATINQIAFAVPAANLGNGAPVAATLASGDLGNGAVTAKLLGNNGTIALSSSTVGALSNGAGDSISYTQIQTTTATNTSATALAAPALADGAVTSNNVAPNVGSKVVNLDAKWTYAYLNGAVVAPGTYGGINANNSRVTYTASMP